MKKNLQDLSNKELLKEARKRKVFFFFLWRLNRCYDYMRHYINIKKGVTTFTFLPIVFLGVALMFWSNYDKVIKELKSRNLKQKDLNRFLYKCFFNWFLLGIIFV